jgi:hypothetical protein
MSKHTEGPWKVSYDGPSNPIVTSGQPFDIVCLVQNTREPDASEPNAHLIAAAPDMLEALKAIQQSMGGVVNTAQQVAWDKLKAAIAKAEGK